MAGRGHVGGTDEGDYFFWRDGAGHVHPVLDAKPLRRNRGRAMMTADESLEHRRQKDDKFSGSSTKG